jgi:hypothetical protein
MSDRSWDRGFLLAGGPCSVWRRCGCGELGWNVPAEIMHGQQPSEPTEITPSA